MGCEFSLPYPLLQYGTLLLKPHVYSRNVMVNVLMLLVRDIELTGTESFLLNGSNISRASNKDAFVNKRRQMPMYGVLIDHPHEGKISSKLQHSSTANRYAAGLILWEVSSAASCSLADAQTDLGM